MGKIVSRGVLAMVGFLGLCAGCRSEEAQQARQEKSIALEERRAAERERRAAAATRPIPADSPFAKVKLGMGIKEVYDLIGQPTDTSSHITGKQFNPFYFGGDTHRFEAMYKGQGRVVFSRSSRFSGDMQVIEINYDPNERGYN